MILALSSVVLICCIFNTTGWNELLIASFSHRSMAVSDGILLATGLHVHRYAPQPYFDWCDVNLVLS